jgi:hypothetical protein
LLNQFSSLNFKCPYHAIVIKILDTINNDMV